MSNIVLNKFNKYQTTLSRLKQKCRNRTLIKPAGIDFTSNDYLALSTSDRMRKAIVAAIDNGIPIGATGSRLLRGHHTVFDQLETEASTFFKSERALFFNSGYSANLAIFSALPQRGDMIFYDEQVHASILDGIFASKADAMAIKHNDLEEFNKKILIWRKNGGVGHPWIAVESIYSMDGDRAPLIELWHLANQQDGFLVIDEAHATGVFGPHGRGLATFYEGQDNVILLHTCGKALGASGGLICSNQIFYEYLINRARSFIYSTAPSPLMAVAVREALKILAEDESRLQQLKKLYILANQYFAGLPGAINQGTQIIPIIIGADKPTITIANQLKQRNFDVRAIRPPSVAENTARLRISITLHVKENDISQLFYVLQEIL